MQRVDTSNWTKKMLRGRIFELKDIINNREDTLDDATNIMQQMKNENDSLKAENRELKQYVKDLEDARDGRGYAENRNDLIARLQDQHQQDCIRINDLTTTIHVLAGMYSNLRKTVGMD